MEIIVKQNPSILSEALAEWITSFIESTLAKQDRFTWVVTGGNSPKELYKRLSEAPYSERIEWDRIHIFWGDERAVPFEDDRNNARMTHETLLNHVPIPKENIHIMDTSLEPEAAALEYEKTILHYCGEDSVFDLVLNGMGDDGHTLSLFPNTVAVHENMRNVFAFWLDAQNMYRITLTAPLVNKARRIAFLTFGANKAEALYQVIQGERNVDQYPSQIIQPLNGELYWFIDEAAAAKLS
ncbi:6-phosphogluconolactonase [Gynurincola endophyticus]|uniref:6-phosphogluconolactonase n=1 Tax=Gynurincola endophyticus TaxID=2479004 RepID=UPI000F8E560C|nr:6-phosphogluconolactonase [Gynurincola endophyticus]